MSKQALYPTKRNENVLFFFILCMLPAQEVVLLRGNSALNSFFFLFSLSWATDRKYEIQIGQ